MLTAAPTDRQHDLARRVIDICNDIGDQGTQQPLACAHGHPWRVPGSIEIVRQAGEVGRDDDGIRRPRRLQPRLADLDAA